MKYLLIIILFSYQNVFSAENTVPAAKSASEFFLQEAKLKERVYRFNPYETIISGAIAFVIGNVGFYTTKSSVLKLGYSGVQTIGIINVGHGVYEVNSPSVEGELYKFLGKDKFPAVSKEALSIKLIQVFAQEERAKRMAIFYGSSLLSLQYFVNSFVGDTQKDLKKIYLFMGGVNLIIAAYSGFSQSNYEKKVYGEDLDLRPVFVATDKEAIGGISISYSF